MEIRVEVMLVLIPSIPSQFSAVFMEPGDGRECWIQIGPMEFREIDAGSKKVIPLRPQPYDCFTNILRSAGISVEKVVVARYDEVTDTYQADLYLKQDGRTWVEDCRPSDALALAVRFDCPVFADDEFLTKADKQRREYSFDRKSVFEIDGVNIFVPHGRLGASPPDSAGGAPEGDDLDWIESHLDPTQKGN